MIAATGFDLRKLPADPYEAEKFLTDSIKRLFSLAHESDATSVSDFSMVRQFSMGDPFAQSVKLTLRFEGDPKKLVLATYGETKNEP